LEIVVFLEYVTGLVLTTLGFQLVSMVLAVIPALAMAATSRLRTPSLEFGNAFATQVVLGALYSSLIAIVTKLYTMQHGVVHAWIYVASGFVATYLVLGDAAHRRMKEIGQNPESRSPTAEGAAQGAAIGLLVGLVAYLISYFLPALLGFLPGASGLFGWVILVSDWLSSIWLLQIIVLIVAFAYVLKGAIAVLIVTSLLLHSLRTVRWRPFGRRAA
jgi:hypothetical protein